MIVTNESRRHELRNLRIQPSTHIGLWLDRYLEAQTRVPDASRFEEERAKEARTRLVDEVSGDRIRVARGYKSAFAQRMLSLAHKSPENHTSFAVFRCVGRFIVGLGDSGVLENGLTVERTWGVPVLPGSALKGLAAAAAHKIIEDEGWRKETESTELGESAAYLFGTQEQAGRGTFHDAWWVPDQEEASLPVHSDIITAHNTPYYQEQGKRATKAPDGRQDPVPVSFLSASGSYLVFVSSTPEDADWAAAAMQLLELGLRHLGIGAKTNAGYGRFERDDEATEEQHSVLRRQEEIDKLSSSSLLDLFTDALAETLSSKNAATALCDRLRKLEKDSSEITEATELFNSKKFTEALEQHPRSMSLEDPDVHEALTEALRNDPTIQAWAAGEDGEVSISRSAGQRKAAARWAGVTPQVEKDLEEKPDALFEQFPSAGSLTAEAQQLLAQAFDEDGQLSLERLAELEDQVEEHENGVIELWFEMMESLDD